MNIPTVVVTLIAVFSGSTAIAQNAASPSLGSGYYAGAILAFQAFSDNQVSDVEIEFDEGFAVACQLGYRFQAPAQVGFLRLEGEIEYESADVESLGGVSTSADISVIRGTAGLYLDLGPWNFVQPYLGGGLGAANIDAEINELNIADEAVGLSFHAEGGSSLNLTTQIAIFAAYRYEWFSTDVAGVDENQTAHQIRLGARYAFY